MPASNPLISILTGFAEARSRWSRMTEREVHHGDERPVGDIWTFGDALPIGDRWFRESSDGCGYTTWARTRYVRAANPTAEACADVRAYQRSRLTVVQ